MTLIDKVVKKVLKTNYLLGTIFILDRDADGWTVRDIEQECLFWSPHVKPAARFFIEQETEDVVECLFVLRDKYEGDKDAKSKRKLY